MFRLVVSVALCVCASANAVQVHYDIGEKMPQQLNSVVSCHLPGAQPPVDMRAEQTIDFDVEVLSQNETGKEVAFTLRRYQAHITGNGVDQTYDSKLPGNSPMMGECTNIVDQPLRFRIGPKGHFEGGAHLTQMMERRPLLAQMLPDHFFTELMASLFALDGEELHPSKTVRGDVGSTLTSPPVEYKVESIKGGNITASFRGELSETEVPLQLSGGQPITTKLSGRTIGEWKCNSRNGLDVELQGSSFYNGVVCLEGDQVPATIQADLRISKRLPDGTSR